MTTNDTTIAQLLEQLIAEGPQAMREVTTTLMNVAMSLEREQFLGAGRYERGPERRGYANGYKPKRIDTTAGTLHLDIPKTSAQDVGQRRTVLSPEPGTGPALVPRRHAGGG